MYNKGDLSYLKQPKFMSEEVVDALFERIVEHCLVHDLSDFTIVLHGGEPLLAGMDRIGNFIAVAEEKGAKHGVSFSFSIQTNGLLITPEWCDFLNKNNIKVGISIDGEKEVNDKYRVDHSGRGSYDDIVRAIKICRDHYNGKIGLLSVLDVNSDPVQALDHFVSLGAQSIDFLLPDNNYEDLPCHPENGRYKDSPTPYGDWLVDLYDYWNSMSGETKPEIRIFHNLIYKFCGITIASDMMGQEENQVLVIETNGEIEPIDSMKICGEGFTKSNMNVLDSKLDDAFQLELARLYYNSSEHLSEACIQCPILDFCGGGFIAHRYSRENGFLNPTVYCKDYIRLITHVQSSLVAELPLEINSINEVSALSFEEVVGDLNINAKTFY